VVAIKVLFGAVLQQRFIERFQAEARAVAKMNHPNVIRIYEVGEQNGIHFLVMEYIQGMDLLSYLHEKKPSFDEVLEIVNDVAEALGYCHKQGIIHRDLKPTNILMREKTPILIDFGLAKAVDPNLNVTLTLSGEVVGSPAYMSPEQASGQQVGILSDICSLGIIMYELISFKNPYLDPRSLHQTALNAIKAEPVPLRYLTPWLDGDFAAMVNMSMAKDQADRYHDVDMLLHDLHAFRKGEPIRAKPPSLSKTVWRFVKGNPILYIGVGVMLFSLLLVFVFVSIQEENRKAPWGLVLDESFNKPDSSFRFTSLDRAADGTWQPSTSWKLKDGRLETFCPGQCAAIAEQDFFGDVRVEFKVRGLNGSNNDMNVFIFGPDPDEGFRFTLGEWGGSQASIEFGSLSRFPFGGVPVKLNGGVEYKVTLEKEDNQLRLFLDNTLLTSRTYTLPVKIDRNSRFGFYTWNASLSIDELKVYKKAIALSASPTVVADAYLEEGFIRNGIPAYRHVIEAYSGKAVAYEAQMKLGKSYMVLGQWNSAIPNLLAAATGSSDAKLIPEALFHLSQCYFQLGHTMEAYEKLKLLPQTYPESDLNLAVIENRVEAVYKCLNGRAPVQACAETMIEEYRFLIQTEDVHRSVFGRHAVELIELFRKLGENAPMQQSLRWTEYYRQDEEIRTGLQLCLVRYYAGLGDLTRADALLAEINPSQSLSRDRQAELALTQGLIGMLQGRYTYAADKFDRTYRNFSDVNGIPFRCIVHSLVLNSLVKVPVLSLDDKLYSNDAVSRTERMQLAYLANRITWEYFHRGLPPRLGRMKNLEDVLVEYLKVSGNDGIKPAESLLTQALMEFPGKTMESVYLKTLLVHLQRP
jgi:serine/threonine protein kinase/small nuclear ribonucleoprotein (snRNP)-like protein